MGDDDPGRARDRGPVVSDVVAILTARLDEKEVAIRDDIAWWWGSFDRIEVHTTAGIVSGGEQHVAPFLDPARVLADVAAKRAIVERYKAAVAEDDATTDQEYGWVTTAVRNALEEVLELMAASLTDHNESRRPDAPH